MNHSPDSDCHAQLLEIQSNLADGVGAFLPPDQIAFTYNPLQYAVKNASYYLTHYATMGDGAKVLFLGMNPGPWGMAQTGIPFGDPIFVRDWMKIDFPLVDPPKEQHPKRPILGISSPRREVSGSRLWGWAQERYVTPEKFFENYFVWNYCPLSFMLESGANFTPNKFNKTVREELYRYCDAAIVQLVELLDFNCLVGVGAFAEQRLKSNFKKEEKSGRLKIGKILHPSPASPVANRGWKEAAEAQLVALGALR